MPGPHGRLERSDEVADHADADDEQDDPESDAIVFGEAGLLVALSVVATALGVAALYSLSTNPLVDFDVDLYLSINRALNASGGGMGSGGVGDGIVGAGGIGYELQSSFRMFEYERVSAIIILIFFTIFLIDNFSSFVRSKIK